MSLHNASRQPTLAPGLFYYEVNLLQRTQNVVCIRLAETINTYPRKSKHFLPCAVLKSVRGQGGGISGPCLDMCPFCICGCSDVDLQHRSRSVYTLCSSKAQSSQPSSTGFQPCLFHTQQTTSHETALLSINLINYKMFRQVCVFFLCVLLNFSTLLRSPPNFFEICCRHQIRNIYTNKQQNITDKTVN